MADFRIPVIVGAGQVGGASGCGEPLELIQLAIERAVLDSGSPHILQKADLLAVARTGTRRYVNAALSLADRFGLEGVRVLQADFGGHMAQGLLAHVANDIAVGKCDVAVVAGGEMGSLLRRNGGEPLEDTDSVCPQPEVIGDPIEDWIPHPAELALGLHLPAQFYPMFDTAIGWSQGKTISDHMRDVANLWASFSRVAHDNPHADDPGPYTADAILTPSDDNRYVGYPYTKAMNSNQYVDQACALVLCSHEVADALGIAKDRRVYPLASAEAHAGLVSHRASLAHSPQLARAAAALAEATGCSASDADFIDLYACFPSAVELQAQALGVGVGRPLTLTGGMRFAGGPWNSYALHMMANLVDRLRQSPHAYGVCSANGGLASRFVVAGYSGSPPARRFQQLSSNGMDRPEDWVTLAQDFQGEARIEGFSVWHPRRGPAEAAFISCRTPTGARRWARLENGDELRYLLAVERPDASVRFTADGAELLP